MTKTGFSLAAGIAVLLAGASPAMAYVGPGAGITMLGALWAVLATVGLALAGLFIRPLRVMLRRRKQSWQPARDEAAADHSHGG